MKKLYFFLCTLFLVQSMVVAQTVNLTPWPKQMTTQSGTYTLPSDFYIQAVGLPDEVMGDVKEFAATLRAATGFNVQIGDYDQPALTLSLSTTNLGQEAYKLTVAATGITLQASSVEGFFYGLQSIKKMLPANVLLGQKDAQATYALPLVTINDAPRFAYRGFMLDVSRHFFTVDEIKKMLRLMAYYKMNHFHWHLTDDQGWRVEVKKYPKLTTVAATRDNSWNTDLQYGQYWTNAQYGPYFYTQAQIREVVEYAAALHITVVPEIEMPGHLAAAMAAYPEFSCNPSGAHSVWVTGGISTDVLNVANERAIQFAKDILSEIAPLFPSDVFHVGGDETPTTAWQNNAECQALYQAEGMSNYSQLQSRFTKIIAEHLQTLGKRIAVWNEAITASGANTQLVKDAGATVYCWNPCQTGAAKAAELGLRAIVTEYNSGGGSYYINRKPTAADYGAGGGDNTLQATYNYLPVPASVSSAREPYYYGVQGTFWCEHVSEPEHLEYLALPRLMAVAEAGWTPQARKNWTSFQARMRQDTTLLRRGGYRYHPQFIDYDGATPAADGTTSERVMPTSSTGLEADNMYWYHIVSKGSGDRTGRQIELLQTGAALLTTMSSHGATANMLWSNTPAAAGASNYDAQLWAFELDPGGTGKYALVNKTAPQGSVNPTASAAGTGGRWSYDSQTKHYNFTLGDNGYGAEGDNYYYSIRSDKHGDWWMNCAMAGNNYAVNLYNYPASGNGGLWTLVPTFTLEASSDDLRAEAAALLQHARYYEDESQRAPGLFSYETIDLLETYLAAPSSVTREQWQTALDEARASLVFPEQGQTYRVSNTLSTFAGEALCDISGATTLMHTAEHFANDAWTVTSLGSRNGLTAKIRLKNAVTGRFVGSPSSTETTRVGYLVGFGTTALTLTYLPEQGDFVIEQGDKRYYPISSSSLSNPNAVAAAASAIRPQGTGWQFDPVRVLTLSCIDQTEGSVMATYTCSRTEDELLQTTNVPQFRGYTFQGQEFVDDTHVRLFYLRSSYNVDVVGRDSHGAIVVESFGQQNVDACGTYCPEVPLVPYYTPTVTTIDCGDRPCQDTVYTILYETDAFAGVRRLGQAVSRLDDGHSYVLFDTSPNATERIGYRNIDPATGRIMQAADIVNADPYYVWTLERVGTTGNRFRVKNELTGKYIPQLTQSGAIYVSDAPDTFTFTHHDGDVWEILGSNGQYWDGVAGAFTGWHTYGHPYKIYEYYTLPFYQVTIAYVYEDGTPAAATQQALVEAGQSYTLAVPSLAGYVVKEIENAEALSPVSSNATVRVVYIDETTGIASPTLQTPSAQGFYDMQGRRVVAPQRGIYITNGTKVLIR
ncbi:MAG: beta-N-acetylhexosaminidase [Bacteroidaceae bacterium]|nr:beta-N-acetylhexosaminidase [Bacteroidaceae bacterium]